MSNRISDQMITFELSAQEMEIVKNSDNPLEAIIEIINNRAQQRQEASPMEQVDKWLKEESHIAVRASTVLATYIKNKSNETALPIIELINEVKLSEFLTMKRQKEDLLNKIVGVFFD